MGIANRGFERRFELADFVRVEQADLRDVLLVIDLLREIPETMKPKKITIGKTETANLADHHETASPFRHELYGGCTTGRPLLYTSRLCWTAYLLKMAHRGWGS